MKNKKVKDFKTFLNESERYEDSIDEYYHESGFEGLDEIEDQLIHMSDIDMSTVEVFIRHNDGTERMLIDNYLFIKYIMKKK